MKTFHLVKALQATILFSLIYSVLGILFGFSFSTTLFLWSLFPNFLISILLVYYLVNASYKGIKASLAVVAIYFVIGSLNILIEAVIFNVTELGLTLRDLLKSLIAAVVFSPLLVWMLNSWEGTSSKANIPKKTPLKWLLTIVMCIFLYIVFYFTAGIILQLSYPGLMDFYADKVPTFQIIILTQIPRGFLFTSIAMLVLFTSRLSTLKASILVGLIFSVFGGIAPLMNPNEFMPFDIRLAHSFEVGISNFLYGFVISYYWLGDRKKEPKKHVNQLA